MITVDNLPVEIITSSRAVVWKFERRDGKPKPTKVPYMATDPMVRAAVNRPATWGPFATALAAVEAGLADGVGVVLVGDGLSGVDLDHCVDPETGRVTDWALAIVDEIDTYTERSPSGTGLRILAHGSLPPGGRKRGDVEMYDTLRFLSITGQHVAGTPTVIHERGEALAAVHRRVFGAPVRSEPERRGVVYLERDDAALLRRAHDARNGAKFGMLWRGDTSAYPSPSEADLGLVSMLVYWTGGDAARVDRLFRQSALYRPKWDAARGSDTYGERTIARAIARCG